MERKSSLESVVRMPLIFIIPGDSESLESLSAIIKNNKKDTTTSDRQTERSESVNYQIKSMKRPLRQIG